MSKTITVDDEAYKLLASLKQDGRDSFTKVILRHIYRPAETCGELLDLTKDDPPPSVDPKVLRRILRKRGRRAGGSCHRNMTGRNSAAPNDYKR